MLGARDGVFSRRNLLHARALALQALVQAPGRDGAGHADDGLEADISAFGQERTWKSRHGREIETSAFFDFVFFLVLTSSARRRRTILSLFKVSYCTSKRKLYPIRGV